jgi:putative transposase
VAKIRKKMPRIGGKKLYFLINQDTQRQQFKSGEQRFFDILKKYNLLVKKRKKYIQTTDSKLWRGQFDNLLEEISIHRAEQVWVADITYFRTQWIKRSNVCQSKWSKLCQK